MPDAPSPAGADPWVPGRRRSGDPRSGVVFAGDQPVAAQPRSRPEWFDGLDLQRLTDAALSGAAGAEHADVRITNTRTAHGTARDAELVGDGDGTEAGLSVRVVLDGCWGFAASDHRTTEAAADTAARALAMARRAAAVTTRRVALAPEPVHRGSWHSSCGIDPFDVAADQRQALLRERTADLSAAAGVDHSDGRYLAIRERVHYADLSGTFIQQQRIRVEAAWTAVHVAADGTLHSMGTVAPPAGRGWEYIAGIAAPVAGAAGWDWDAEIAALPDLLREKSTAPTVEPGIYDLLIDPTNLWLTIHESVGHATELDRALGYEANYAGTTFATPDQLGSLRYGSPAMNVVADRTAAHGLSSVAWDDEGVAAQRWDIVRDGVLVGYQRDRAMTAEFGLPRSNGCAYADSAGHVPIQRMPNISLAAAPGGPGLDDMIAMVDDGILIIGDNSWSIDMQRYNFQFTGQRFWRIRDGRVAGQLRDVAYQSSTPKFWAALDAVGGPNTYMLGGAVNCGKGQPGQTAPVSHGAPAALLRGIGVLNTAAEGRA